MMKNLSFIAVVFLTIGSLNAQIIFDNGPLFNSPGTGSGGANESVLQTTTLGMGTIGFGQQSANFNRIADDFTVSDCRWKIDSIALFGYQTGSTLTSTFTGYNVRIWDGPPNSPTSNVIFGDTTTNRLIRTEWSGVYRITETTTGNTQRPIMRNVLTVAGLELTGGNYWLDWSASGSLASGPWQPSIAILGQPVTGNGLQRVGSTWNNMVDGGTGTPAQGAPFIIYGTVIYNPTVDAGTNQSVCEQVVLTIGGAPTATGNGPVSYAWTSNLLLSDTTIANPQVTITDTLVASVQVTDSIGCSSMDMLTVFPLSNPSVVIDTIGSTEFCFGGSVIYTTNVTGGLTWSNNQMTDSITVTTDGLISVIYTDTNGCVAFDTVETIVYPLPNVFAGTDFTVCENTSTTVTASGANAYTWNNGIVDNTPFIPNSTLQLIVTGTDLNGCMNNDTLTLTVENNPVVIAGSDIVTCEGDLVTFTAVGADFYNWSNGAQNGIPFLGSVSGLATVTGTTLNGCLGVDTLNVTVNPVSDSTLVINAIDSYTINGQTYSSDGIYQQTFTNSFGCDSVLTIDLTLEFTGLNNYDLGVAIYPNPASSELYVKLNSTLDADFSIFDLSGRAVAKGRLQSELTTISLAGLGTGKYILRFDDLPIAISFLKK